MATTIIVSTNQPEIMNLVEDGVTNNYHGRILQINESNKFCIDLYESESSTDFIDQISEMLEMLDCKYDILKIEEV